MVHEYLKHAAPVVTEAGPTGEFVEVLHGEIQDYGGNVLFRGTADACVMRTYKHQTRLVPLRCRIVTHPVAGAHYLWSPVLRPEVALTESRKG